MRRRTQRSVTMLEVVTAIVILSLGLVPMMRGFVDGAERTSRAIQASIASFLVTERMEEIVAARYRNNTGYSLVTTGNFPNQSPVTGFTGFNRTVTVQTVDNSLNNSGSDIGLKKVTVSVNWNSASRKMELTRIFADF